LKPYKIIVVKDNYYEFTTSAGIRYACYFLSYSEYFKDYKAIADNIYAFNVELLKRKKINVTLDERIGFTVVQIVKHFLEGLVNAVVYVCDTSYSRELIRKRKFDSWFRQYDFIEAFNDLNEQSNDK
jgi:hypothetical protein